MTIPNDPLTQDSGANDPLTPTADPHDPVVSARGANDFPMPAAEDGPARTSLLDELVGPPQPEEPGPPEWTPGQPVPPVPPGPLPGEPVPPGPDIPPVPIRTPDEPLPMPGPPVPPGPDIPPVPIRTPDEPIPTSGAPRRVVEERSLGELMGDISRDFSTLMRQEVELARAEVKESATRAGRGGGMLAGAGVAGWFTLLFLSVALWWALGLVVGLGWSAVLVAVLWAVVALVLVMTGRTELARVRGLPRTAETVSKIPNALKGNEEDNR